MDACPACAFPLTDAAVECPACGIVISKWRPREERPPRPAAATAAPEASAFRPPTAQAGSSRGALVRTESSPLKRWLAMALVGGLGGALIAGGYWWVELRPRLERIENRGMVPKAGRMKAADVKNRKHGDFDREVALEGGSPRGLAAGPGLLLTANRDDPWGFVRLQPRSKSFSTQKAPVTEKIYNQNVSFNAVTWNGSNFVSYTRGSWFERNDTDVFTIHDPDDLRVLDMVDAPRLIGALVWDGNGYWAATRRNTRDADERALLYHFNEDLRQTATYEPPAYGCQGLAWDGNHLWFVDVFNDRIYVLDVNGAAPRVVREARTELDYLSGIAFFEGEIWVAEYDDDKIHRLSPEIRTAWTQGRDEAGELRVTTAEPPPRRAAGTSEEVEQWRRQLRSDDMFERMDARDRLKEAGEKIDYDRDSEPMDDRSAQNTRVEKWEVELQEGTLLGSWEIYFGEDLFGTESRITDPSFISIEILAKYDITIEGGSLREPKRIVFQATPGLNRKRDHELASRLGPGTYEVDLFVHVQYIKPDGTGQILNRSGMTLRVER